MTLIMQKIQNTKTNVKQNKTKQQKKKQQRKPQKIRSKEQLQIYTYNLIV